MAVPELLPRGAAAQCLRYGQDASKVGSVMSGANAQFGWYRGASRPNCCVCALFFFI